MNEIIILPIEKLYILFREINILLLYILFILFREINGNFEYKRFFFFSEYFHKFYASFIRNTQPIKNLESSRILEYK